MPRIAWGGWRRVGLGGLCSGLCLGCGAATLELPALEDTTLFFQSPQASLGASDSLAVGATAHDQPARALLKFGVGTRAELKGAKIVGARLVFTVSRLPSGGGVASGFELHRMQVGWSEGGGTGNTGSPAEPGDSTWAARQHPSTPWAQPGGKAGVDFVSAGSGSVRVSGVGRYVIDAPGLSSDVQAWIADPTRDFGWILMSDAENVAATARRIASREAPGDRAVLSVDFETAVAAGPRIERVERKGDRLEFEFRAEAGNVYVVQHRDALSVVGGEEWVNGPSYTAKLVSTNIVVSESISSAASRFFRVADVGDVD